LSEGPLRSAIDYEYQDDALSADEDWAIILGKEILSLLEEFPNYELSRQVLAFLDASVTEDKEPALFNLCPRSAYGVTS
jgi:hypothetical protein